MRTIRYIFNKITSLRGAEAILLRKLKNTPRYQKRVVYFSGIALQIIDAPSFIFQYKEIFERKIYNFLPETSSPRIIDCGANIGLSVIFFKKIYPNSRITAFEADPDIFLVLENNMKKNFFNDVELVNKAVWTNNTILKFTPDNSDGGKLSSRDADEISIDVSTTRLKDYINSDSIDFLKIDIEGAETDVLESCQSELLNVKHLFVEYHSFIYEKQQLHRLLTILSVAGFRVRINSISNAHQPFIKQNKKNNIMDMQLNIFADRE